MGSLFPGCEHNVFPVGKIARGPEEGTILLMNMGKVDVQLDKSQVIGHLWVDPWVVRESVGSRHPGVVGPPPAPASTGADEAGKVPEEYQHLEFTSAEGDLHQSGV